MSAGWFSAKVRVICLVEGAGATMQDESVHVFRASGVDGAFARALQLGREQEGEYLNSDGERVRWRFDRVLTLDALGAEDLDGVEVHSELGPAEESLPFDAEFDPENHKPTETGV